MSTKKFTYKQGLITQNIEFDNPLVSFDDSSGSKYLVELNENGVLEFAGTIKALQVDANITGNSSSLNGYDASDFTLDLVTSFGNNTNNNIKVNNLVTQGNVNGPHEFYIDPADDSQGNTGKVIITGNVQIEGETTTINSTTLKVDDKTIIVSNGAINNSEANNSGLVVDGSDAKLLYKAPENRWDFDRDLNVNGTLFSNEIQDSGSRVFSPSNLPSFSDIDNTIFDSQVPQSSITQHAGSLDWNNLAIDQTDVSKIDVGLGNVPNEDATDPINWDYDLSGSETTVVTGNPGNYSNLLEWDSGGDAVDSGISSFDVITGVPGNYSNLLEWDSGGDAVDSGISSFDVILRTDRLWKTVSSNYVANEQESILADVSSGSFTITLPSSPTLGTWVQIGPGGGDYSQNPLTIGRNGETIMGLSEDLTINTKNKSVELAYNGDWRLV